jgi:hypothetical protein
MRIKPEKETIQFYDWHCVCKFLGWSNEKESKVWNYIIGTNDDNMNGRIFTISNWELVFENGRFSYLVPEWYKLVLTELLDNFGEEDTGTTTPNCKSANFRCNW